MCDGSVAGHQRLPDLTKGHRQSRGKRRVAMDAVSARLGVNVAVDKPVLLQHTAKKETTPVYCAFPRRTTPLPGSEHQSVNTSCCDVCCAMSHYCSVMLEHQTCDQQIIPVHTATLVMLFTHIPTLNKQYNLVSVMHCSQESDCRCNIDAGHVSQT